VDLFSGCGGLSLGFELFNGNYKYETIMALDNYEPAVKCFNKNFDRRNGGFPIARVCDLTWFSHSDEVLLYYLVHYSLVTPDNSLLESLRQIGLMKFLFSLKSTDVDYHNKISELVSSSKFIADLEKVDSKIFNIAIFKSFINRLGLTSLKLGTIESNTVPWKEEYTIFESQLQVPNIKENFITVDEIHKSVSNLWETEVAKLTEASLKQGTGQHKDVSRRLKTLVAFLNSQSGKDFKEIWVEWKSRRDSIRAVFCLKASSQLKKLYFEGRQVQLVLGGPPCKGFSRIGRAVIESLRDQGVHAWISKDYGDERNALLHKYVLFLDALKPNAFLFENVAQFKSSLKTPNGKLEGDEELARAIEELSNNKLHYEIYSQIIKAKEFAIPQDRQRFILVGFNLSNVRKGLSRKFFEIKTYDQEVPLIIALQGLESPGEFSTTCKTDYKTRAYTLVDKNMPESYIKYIEWIRQPKPGDQNSPVFVDAHIVRKLREDDLGLLKKFGPGQRWMDYKLKNSQTFRDLDFIINELLKFSEQNSDFSFPFKDILISLSERINEGLLLRLMLEEIESTLGLVDSHHLLTNGYLDKGTDRHGDWFQRLSPDKPSNTIVAHIGKDTYGFMHPYLDRAISIREAARIQSFPDYFTFGEIGVVDAYTMIGNAVPPLLANMFAESFAKLHEKYDLFKPITEEEIKKELHQKEESFQMLLEI
jgi:DNA-cytosine methyltransferase